MEKFERIVQLTPAFDRRHIDPSKNYGIHGVNLRMILKGEKGAVQFVLYTNWMLPHVQMELEAKYPDHHFCHPLPADKGYHSLKPMYEGQTSFEDSCEYLDGKQCYYDGSGLNAEDTYRILLEKGSEGVWQDLEEYYYSTLGGQNGL